MTPDYFLKPAGAAVETLRVFDGLMQYTHAFGDTPCGYVAFYGPLGVLADTRPLAFAHGGLAIPLAPMMFRCAVCGREVDRTALRPEAATLPQVYHADRRARRRRRGLRPIADQTHPASIGQIALATGVNRDKLREMCELGAVPGAFRGGGVRRDWRVPMVAARALIALLNAAAA